MSCVSYHNPQVRSYIKGSCHCKAVKFEIPFSGEFNKLRRCDCSLCSKKWAVVASILIEDLKVVEGKDKLSLYQWNTKIAKHIREAKNYQSQIVDNQDTQNRQLALAKMVNDALRKQRKEDLNMYRRFHQDEGFQVSIINP